MISLNVLPIAKFYIALLKSIKLSIVTNLHQHVVHVQVSCLIKRLFVTIHINAKTDGRC